MHNIKLIVAYLGTRYRGWQKTSLGPSIEGVLTEAVHTIVQHPVCLQAASRTDAGVHAKGQIVNFFSDTKVPLERLHHSLNRLLPKDVVVKEISLAPPSFHPTLDAKKKRYLYEVCTGPVQLPFHRHTSWHVPLALDVEKMQEAARLLLGLHDFSAFCNERSLWDRDPTCHLEELSILPLPQERLLFVLCGDRFLYKMVRNLVGTLVYVGQGKIAPSEIPTILERKERSLAGVTAPAKGLCLFHVY